MYYAFSFCCLEFILRISVSLPNARSMLMYFVHHVLGACTGRARCQESYRKQKDYQQWLKLKVWSGHGQPDVCWPCICRASGTRYTAPHCGLGDGFIDGSRVCTQCT